MNVKNIEKKEKNTAEITVEITAEEFDKAVNAAYLKNRTKINIPGFRKGKAPRKMIEKMFWFFRFQYTIGPVVLAALIFTVIGAGVPLVVYCVVGKQTIVERLRETE